MEAVVSGHPQDTKKVYVTGAGHFWECKNTEFVWQLRKTVKVAISRAVRLRECSWKSNFILKIFSSAYYFIFLLLLCHKDKKAAKEKEREQRIAEAELENVHSARNIEAEKLKEILTAKGLSIKEVILIIWSHFFSCQRFQ